MEPFHQSVLIAHSLALSKKYSGTSSECDFGNDLTIVLAFKGSSVPIMVVAHPERCCSGGSFRGRVKKSDLYHWVVPLKGFWAPALLLSFVGHLSGKLFSSTTPLQLPPSGTLTRGPKGTGPVSSSCMGTFKPVSKIHHLSLYIDYSRHFISMVKSWLASSPTFYLYFHENTGRFFPHFQGSQT